MRKFRYAKVITPRKKEITSDGHYDTFEPNMKSRKVILVEKHDVFSNWYYGWTNGIEKGPYNYHRSWLQFVSKPKNYKEIK